MNDQEDPQNPSEDSHPDGGGSPSERQQVSVSNVTARVPDNIGNGVFSTGAIVMSAQHEVVIDFVQRIGQPSQIVSRIVLPRAVAAKFIAALEENLSRFEQQFGPLPQPPKPNPEQPRPSIQEVYDNMKLPDDQLSGSYANAVLIRHSAAEFSFDFVTTFFPNSAVSSRVFLTAYHVRPLLDSLRNNLGSQ